MATSMDEPVLRAPCLAKEIMLSLTPLDTSGGEFDIVTVPPTPSPISPDTLNYPGHGPPPAPPFLSLAGADYAVHTESKSLHHPCVKEDSLFLEAVSAPVEPLAANIRRRRKALLIGIEYAQHPDVALDGPHADVDEIKDFLQEAYKWDENCFTVLKDDARRPEHQPTREIMIREFRNLVVDAREGDNLFLYFSGHGTQVKDLDGDEIDGKDEAIVSSDAIKIIDDELHEVLVKPLPAGCRLTALFDCCSSGTGLDLPVDVPMLSKDLGFNSSSNRKAEMMDLFHNYEVRLRNRSVPQIIRPPIVRRKYSDGDVILWAACQDSQRAHGVRDRYNRMKGAMTSAFIESLRKRKEQTYQQLLESICEKLKVWELCQTPQLSSSQKVDMNAYFSI